LEDLSTARVAGVGVDLEEGLDFGDAGDDSSDGDELAEVRSANLTDGEDGVVGEGAEVEVAVTVGDFVNIASREEKEGKKSGRTNASTTAAETPPDPPPHSERSCCFGGTA
jgi:hypothetical protein